jgi:hypothetical protein
MKAVVEITTYSPAVSSVPWHSPVASTRDMTQVMESPPSS